MKKFFAAVLSAAAVIMMTGCSRGISAISGADAPAETTMATIEAVTEAPLPDISGLPIAEGEYLHEKWADVLTADEAARLNSYCEKLYRERLINIAVVITDDLGGKSPYDYAADSYDSIYEGRGSGLLLLINNDKGDDCLYRTGSALRAIPDGAEKVPLYWSTMDIMNGDCYSAILRILQLGENCPQYVFDNIGAFTEEELASLEEELAGKKSVYVLATSNGTDKSNEEICRSYFERRSDGKGFMIMLDTKSSTVTVVSDGNIPSEVAKAKTSADKLLKDGNAVGAVNEIVSATG